MSDVHGSEARLYLSGVDISSQFRESEAGRMRGMVDATCYGDASSTHVVDPFGNGMINAEGILAADQVTGARPIQDAIETAGNVLTGDEIVVLMHRDVAVGDNGFLVVGTVHENTVTSMTKDVAKTKFAAQANRSLWGRALHPKAARTAAYTTVGLVETAATAFGGVGILQVFAMTGTTPVLAAKLQHSIDTTNGVDGTWVDLGTPFAAINAANVLAGYADQEVIAGTVNKGTRLVLTVTSGTLTSVTFAAQFGRYTAIN